MESTEPAPGEITQPTTFLRELRGFTQGQRICLYILVGLSLWVLIVTLKIEWLNYRAGFYLPRTDYTEGGNNGWRNWGNNPNGWLHDWVVSFGLLQYELAPILLILAFVTRNILRKHPWRWLPLVSILIALTAFSLAIYRGYFSSID